MDTPLGPALIQVPGSALHEFAGDMQADLGLDLATDVRSLTLYSRSAEDRDGVAILVTTAAADRLPTTWQEQHGHGLEVTRHGTDDVYSWTLRDTRWFASIRPDGEKRRVFVLTQSRQSAIDALDVLEGRRESLKTEPGHPEACESPRLDPKPCTRSLCYLTATNEAWKSAARGPRTEVLRGAQSLVFDASEHRDESGTTWISSRITLRMHNEEAAANARHAVDGAIAWIKLIGEREQAPECARDAVSSIAASHEGGEVRVFAKVRMDDLLRLASMLRNEHVVSAERPESQYATESKQSTNCTSGPHESDQRSKKSDTPAKDRAKNKEPGPSMGNPR